MVQWDYPPEPRKCSYRSREKSICRSFSDIFGGKLRCPSRPIFFSEGPSRAMWTLGLRDGSRPLIFPNYFAVQTMAPWFWTRSGFQGKQESYKRRFKLHSKRCVGCFVGMLTWVITYCHQFITCPCSFVCACVCQKNLEDPQVLGYDSLG